MARADQRSSASRRGLLWALRIAALVLVCVGVGGTVRHALDELSHYEWQVQPSWLIASGGLYLIGLLFMAWYWYRTLAALGHPTPWPTTLRAYFLGHLGKYVPGKAMSVILRVAAVRKWVPSLRIAILSTMLETLTMMAVGAFLAAVLSAFLLRSRPELAAVALVVATAVVVPTLPPVTRWLVRMSARRQQAVPQSNDGPAVGAPSSERHDSPEKQVESNVSGLDMTLLIEGWLASALCWLFLGMSLWATLRAIGVADMSLVENLPNLIAAVALAVVAGFVSMLPGGLGVRDLALVQLLSETCGPADALVAAVLMRLVWLVSESAACVILYMAARFSADPREPPFAA
jgi:uncharacterized membrane protein YbhN (UPF0104 family)